MLPGKSSASTESPLTPPIEQGEGHPPWAWPALAGIVALGAALRLWHLDVVAFQIDEAMAATLATQMAHGRAFHLAGIRTSLGFLNPPWFLYLLTPVFALSASPLVAGVVVALAGAAAPLAAHAAGRLMGGWRVGMIAALVVAVCPAAVEHSRRLWGHDLQVPMAALVCWMGALAWRRGDGRWAGGAMAAAVLAQSFHLAGGVLVLGPAALLAAGRGIRHRGAGWAMGVAGAVVVYTPWMVHDARSGWADVRLLAGLLAGGAAARDVGVPVGGVAAWVMVLGDLWHNDLLGARRPWMAGPMAGWAAAVQYPAAVLLLGMGLARLVMARGGAALLLAPPLLGGLVLFGLGMRLSVPPYQLPVLVPAALAAAMAIGHMWRRGGAVLLVVYTAASVALVVAVRSHLATAGAAGVTLRDRLALLDHLAAESGGAAFNLVQDARRPGAGIDVAWLYLLHARGMVGDYRPEGAAAGRHFVVHDERRPLAPAAGLFLRRHGGWRVGPLVVYTLDDDSWIAWDALRRAYPLRPRPSPAAGSPSGHSPEPAPP